MTQLPSELYRAAQVRELDRIAIEEYGVPGLTLMNRAGAVAFRRLRLEWPQAHRLAVVCGSGNNGGDGYVLARLAREAGLAPTLFRVRGGRLPAGSAAEARKQALGAGVNERELSPGALDAVDVVVDALLGTGLAGEVTGPCAEAVEAINRAPGPVLALDIPSGLSADSGAVLGVAVQATATVTFIGLKQGLVTGDGPEHCGRLYFDRLQLPEELDRRLTPAARRRAAGAGRHLLPPRPRDAHKGLFGHVLVVGGDSGMAGAARLAAEAAMRVGAGLVSVATRGRHVPAITGARPELMAHGIGSAGELSPLLERASVVAIGPGLGTGPWGKALFARVLDSDKPLVVDADGLNLLALGPVRRDRWVLTPHPGEAGRLLGQHAGTVQADRFAAATALQARFGGAVVLKGSGTLVADTEGAISVCDGGNPGMASGGMGDVLTGVIAGLLAQGHGLDLAATLGVCLHAGAADRAAAAGERGLLASDLFPELRRLVNP